MATLQELNQLFRDGDLLQKIEAAIVIEANVVLNEVTEGADRRQWAESAMADPEAEAVVMIRFLLAVNEGLSQSAIQGASDAAIKTNVADAVDDRFGEPA